MVNYNRSVMKRGIIAITACIFSFAFLHADSYWTVERILDIYKPGESHIAFDSLGNMHALFREWEKEEDDTLMETLTVYASRGFYVKYDNKGKLKLSSRIHRSCYMWSMSIIPYIDSKVIIAWENLWSENMVILGDSGEVVSKNYGTASTAERITFGKNGDIFVMGEHYGHGSMCIFTISLESIVNDIKLNLRGFRGIDDGKMHHYFGTSPPDYALTVYDDDKLLIALRIKTTFKGTPEEVYTTEDRFMILRLNRNGEDIEKYEIVHLKLDGYSVINGANVPHCNFSKSGDGSIFLYAESRDHEDVVYQIKFSKDGKLIVPEERITTAANRFESIDNLKQVRVQYMPKFVDRNTMQRIIHLYGFDAAGEMYYSTTTRERKFK